MLKVPIDYLIRPGNIVRRMIFRCRPRHDEHEICRLRCGLPIRVRPNEYLGYSLCVKGVYDLALSEAIVRLARKGDVCLDVGANIGYTALLMGASVGSGGQVHAFEPLAENFADLQYNIRMNDFCFTVLSHNVAASEREAYIDARLPAGFEANRGIFSLNVHSLPSGPTVGASAALRVHTVTLDEYLAADARVDLMKVDVEGHELQVFRGADRMLSSHRVRVVLFEEHRRTPCETVAFLRQRGYEVFRLQAGLLRPLVLPAETATDGTLEPNFLATVDVQRVKDAFRRSGWNVLRRLRPF